MRVSKKLLVELPIIRSKYEKTKSAKYKGVLQLVTNQHGLVFDWKITFSEICIDLYSTERWFREPTAIFKTREKLLAEISKRQTPRPSRSAKNLVDLSQQEVLDVNKFLNDRDKFNGSIKSIVGILKGNNPGGEAKRPSSAEMIIDHQKLPIKNFVILIDDLVMKGNRGFNRAVIGAEKISLETFSRLNHTLEGAFNYMQSPKDSGDFKEYLLQIKQYYKEYDEYVANAEKVANKARAEYGNQIDQYIQKNNGKLPFGFTNKVQFQKCHIYEFHDLRDAIIECMKEKREYDSYVKMIKDTENFIPLPEEIHRQFDRHIFTYTLDGQIWAVTEEGHKYIKDIDSKFHNMNRDFMSQEKRYYLELRNQDIQWD